VASESALVDAVRGEADVSHGVTARELLELRAESARWISATALERWLLDEGLAIEDGAPGRLLPTQRALEIAEGLDVRFAR
jgi:hypothetical protein